MTGSKRIMVTGVAGFIGSHVADRLNAEGMELVGVDNLSSGRKESIENLLSVKSFEFVHADVLKDDIEKHLRGCDSVFHLAANPEVKIGSQDTGVHLEQNIVATCRVLEAMRKSDVHEIVFTSTSTVYGEATTIPTPEDYGPLLPVSLYGSSKLSCEAMISAYCHTFGINATILRFANVVGKRSTHGVIYDFVHKLKKDSRRMEIFGREPGTRKSYVHVKDSVEGILWGWRKREDKVEAFNIGSEDAIDVKTIADSVCEEMGFEGVEYDWLSKNDERGWTGDVKTMLLSIEKLKARGWNPQLTSKEAVRLAAKEILEDAR
jgi:UDP-glucose 4-epimerase